MQRLRPSVPRLQPQAERGREVSEICTATVPIPDPDDGTAHDMGCTLPAGHSGKHICECGVMWTPREPSAQAKLDAIRALVNESVARMEPVSWVDALAEILDGDSDGQA